MKRKRGHLEIAGDILEIAKPGAGITAIVYGANLNFPIAKKHIQEMELAGLIQVETITQGKKKTRLYTTTQKGLTFTKSLDEVMAIFMAPLTLEMLSVQEPVQEVSET